MENYEERVVTLAELKRKAKMRELQLKWEDTKRKAGEFWQENKREICILAPFIAGGVGALAKGASRSKKVREEKDIRDRYCWDPSTGHWWETRRKLSNAEWREVESRKRNGEKVGDILASMKLLK